MSVRWNIFRSPPELRAELSKELAIPPLVAQLLIKRGITDPQEGEKFLSPLLQHLHDPFLMKDMDKAVSRIREAISKKERILIFSDYDVDGITSCAVLEEVLKKLGADVYHYIPHRVKEGYGLSQNAVKVARKHDVKLLIALDCGIKSFKEVESLNKHKIDVIIVDHHQPEEGQADEIRRAAFGAGSGDREGERLSPQPKPLLVRKRLSATSICV